MPTFHENQSSGVFPGAPPTLSSNRLILRAWRQTDAPHLAELINDADIARMTSSVPHPYPPQAANGWISLQAGQRARAEALNFAITLADDTLVGSIGVFQRRKTALWEIGYWIGKPFWGRGIATEAGRTLMDWATRQPWISPCLQAGHFADNPASGRILNKLGFKKVDEKTDFGLARGGRYNAIRYIWPHDADIADISLDARH